MKPINEFITEMTRDEVIEIIRDNRPRTKNFRLTTKDGKSQNARLFVSQDGYPAYFAGRSRTRGYRLSDSQCDQLKSVTPLGVHSEASDKLIHMDKRVKRALGYLKSSGLWKGLADAFSNYLSLSEEERSEFAECTYEGNFKPLHDKYEWLEVWDELFEGVISKRGIKSVNYYSDEKDEIISQMKDALDSGKKYYHSWTKGYDNSVSVQHSASRGYPIGNYSEEYRGTGNGHYYILLDFTHALFCEDD